MTIADNPAAAGSAPTTSERRRDQEARLEELRRQIPETIGEGTDPVADLQSLFETWRREPVDPAEIEGYPAEVAPLSLREVTVD